MRRLRTFSRIFFTEASNFFGSGRFNGLWKGKEVIRNEIVMW